MPGRRNLLKHLRTRHLVPALLLLASPVAAHADAGIPMLPVTYPLILLYLVPVIAIETVYIRQHMHSRWLNTIAATAGANTLTMLLGYPMIWILLTALEFHSTELLNQTHSAALVTALTAAWPTPAYGDPWAVPIAFLLLLVPAFLLSAFVEGILLSRLHWLRSERSSTRTVWISNVFSYLFLAIVGCLELWWRDKHL